MEDVWQCLTGGCTQDREKATREMRELLILERHMHLLIHDPLIQNLPLLESSVKALIPQMPKFVREHYAADPVKTVDALYGMATILQNMNDPDGTISQQAPALTPSHGGARSLDIGEPTSSAPQRITAGYVRDGDILLTCEGDEARTAVFAVSPFLKQEIEDPLEYKLIRISDLSFQKFK